MLGVFGLALVLNQYWAIFCYILLGIGYGFVASYYSVYATIIMPPTKVSTAIGLINAALGMGAFLCTFVATWVMTTFGITTFADLAVVYGVLLAVGLAISVILAIRATRLKVDNFENIPEDV